MPNIVKAPKSRASAMLADNVPAAFDMRPLLDERTQAVISRKESQLSEAAQAEDVLIRRIAKIQQEVRHIAGRQIDDLKATKKMLAAVKARRCEIGQSICTTIEDALEFVPGRDLIEKKQHLIEKKQHLAELRHAEAI